VLTPSGVSALLARHGLRPDRRLGQHFLADLNIARRIAGLAGVGAGDRVFEIGAGIGSLTVALAETGAEVVALELDRRLGAALAETVAGCAAPDRVHVALGDALDVDLGALLGDHEWHCVSNLPYNVAAPVVVRLLEEAPMVHALLVMVQREVAERLVAPAGSRTRGRVSVLVEYHARAALAGAIGRTVFVPRPRVDSALVRLERWPEPPVSVPSTERLFSLVKAGFGQRRKQLRGALRPLLGSTADEVLRAAAVDPSARAEALDLDQWAAIARACPEAA